MSIEDRLGCPVTSLPAVLIKDHALILLTIGTFAGARRITDLTGAMKVSFVAGLAWRLFFNLSSPSRRTACRESNSEIAKAEWKQYVDVATLVGFFAGYLTLRFFPFDFEVISRITTRTIGLVCGYRLSGMLLPAMIVWQDPQADREAHRKWSTEQEEGRRCFTLPPSPEAQRTMDALNGAREVLGSDFKVERDHRGNFHKLVDRLAEGLEADLGRASDGVESRAKAVADLVNYQTRENKKLAELILAFHKIWVI